MHKGRIQAPSRAFIRVSSPLTVWWWLGDFDRALFSSFPCNSPSVQGVRCVATSPSRMMLSLHAGVQLLPMLPAIGCCLWGFGFVEDPGKAQILNGSFLRKAALNGSAHCSPNAFWLEDIITYPTFLLCLSQPDLQKDTEMSRERWEISSEKLLRNICSEVSTTRWGEMFWARRKQMRSKWRIWEILSPTLGEAER